MYFPTATALFFLAGFASAHFKLNYPNSLGFDDDNEPQAPCGGEAVTFADSDVSVPVNGFPVALLTTHPAGNFTYRATLDKAAPFNWIELLAVSEKGLGNFCIPNIQVPSNWTGQSGLVQIIGDLPDGTLYQCAAVKFVSGATTTPNSQCTNDTISLTVLSTGNATGTAASNSSSGGTSTTGVGGTSTTSSAPSGSSTGAANTVAAGIFAAGLGAVMAGLMAL